MHRSLLLVSVLLACASAWTLEAPSIRSGQWALGAGGFGGAAGGKKKESKLKPKQQWDRYLDLKKEERYRVAVSKDDKEWLEVGSIKSQGDAFTEAALVKQKGLIADHARRLFPLQIASQDKLEWAYWVDEAWKTVGKVSLDDMDLPSNIDKIIGFEGRPDPASGFYCVYNEGRLVQSYADLRPSSKKLG